MQQIAVGSVQQRRNWQWVAPEIVESLKTSRPIEIVIRVRTDVVRSVSDYAGNKFS